MPFIESLRPTGEKYWDEISEFPLPILYVWFRLFLNVWDVWDSTPILWLLSVSTFINVPNLLRLHVFNNQEQCQPYHSEVLRTQYYFKRVRVWFISEVSLWTTSWLTEVVTTWILPKKFCKKGAVVKEISWKCLLHKVVVVLLQPSNSAWKQTLSGYCISVMDHWFLLQKPIVHYTSTNNF